MRGMAEQRSETRILCADMLEVTWREDGRNRRATALLEDISHSGACLQLERAVPLGAEIHWECPHQRFAGRVRYCAYREIGYFVGVEFHPNTRWSKQAYEPAHLLDLERLIKRVRE